MSDMQIIAVVGPTASGKTGLAIDIAKRYNGEIVSADSMQIYKRMNIGTAKPTLEEMDGVVHHCIDFLEPSEAFSVANYVSMAHEVTKDILKRGKLPIVVGGTGLYISSFLNNINFESTKTNDEIRERWSKFASERGSKALHDHLKTFDPESAEMIHQNNTSRVVRAIEIYELTGVLMSEHRKKSRQIISPYNALKIGLNYENRKILYERIDRRVDSMVENGLVEETKQLLEHGFDSTAIQAIGYKELIPYIKGYYSLEEAIGILKQESRHYAKRQLTWFRRDKDINWFYPDLHSNIQFMQKKIYNTIDNFLNI